jgi:hypothetical protein
MKKTSLFLFKWWNPAKLYKEKALKKRERKKKQGGKDQSPTKQSTQKRQSHKEIRRESLSIKTFTSHLLEAY